MFNPVNSANFFSFSESSSLFNVNEQGIDVQAMQTQQSTLSLEEKFKFILDNHGLQSLQENPLFECERRGDSLIIKVDCEELCILNDANPKDGALIDHLYWSWLLIQELGDLKREWADLDNEITQLQKAIKESNSVSQAGKELDEKSLNNKRLLEEAYQKRMSQNFLLHPKLDQIKERQEQILVCIDRSSMSKKQEEREETEEVSTIFLFPSYEITMPALSPPNSIKKRTREEFEKDSSSHSSNSCSPLLAATQELYHQYSQFIKKGCASQDLYVKQLQDGSFSIRLSTKDAILSAKDPQGLALLHDYLLTYNQKRGTETECYIFDEEGTQELLSEENKKGEKNQNDLIETLRKMEACLIRHLQYLEQAPKRQAVLETSSF